MVALRYAVRVNGFSGIVLTKLDILDGLEKIKICTAYRFEGKLYEEFPKELNILEKCEPVYEWVGGWKENTGGVKEL